MAKRKRPRYGNPARQADVDATSAGRDREMLQATPAGPYDGGLTNSEEFNRAARRACGECGAPVTWMNAAAARGRGVDLTEALRLLGVDDIAGDDVWVCTSCSNFGVMGPSETF